MIFFFKSSTAASTNPDEMAIVALDETTNENEEENIDIGVDDNNVTLRTLFMHRVHMNNLLVLMSNRFTLWIFMIQEIGINLITTRHISGERACKRREYQIPS